MTQAQIDTLLIFDKLRLKKLSLPGFTAIFLLGLLSFSLKALAEPTLSGTPLELSQYLSQVPEKMHLHGQASIKASADKAIVQLMVKTEDSRFSRALNLNKKLRQDIIQQLIQAGIKHQQIQDSQFSSTPEYGFFGEKPNSYIVNNQLSIEIAQGEQLALIGQLVDRYKQVFYLRMDFKHSKQQSYEQKVLKQALSQAMSKKKLYEDSTGLKLEIVSILEQPPILMPPVFYEKQITPHDVGLNAAPSMKMAPPPSQLASQLSSQGFGEIEYSANVDLVLRVK